MPAFPLSIARWAAFWTPWRQTGQAENTPRSVHGGPRRALGRLRLLWQAHLSRYRRPRAAALAWQKGRFEGGRVCDTPVSLVDLAPTDFGRGGALRRGIWRWMARIWPPFSAGNRPRRMVFGQHSYAQGNPLQDPRQRPPRTPEEAALLRASLSSYMAVSPEWKYFYSAPDGQEYLFDRKADHGKPATGLARPLQAALTEMRAAGSSRTCARAGKPRAWMASTSAPSLPLPCPATPMPAARAGRVCALGA